MLQEVELEEARTSQEPSLHIMSDQAGSTNALNRDPHRRNDASDSEAADDTTDTQCPICLHDTTKAASGVPTGAEEEASASTDSLQLAHGPCGHCFCIPCLERHLNAPRHTSERGTYAEATVDHETSRITVTLGLCPICRAELSLFDLRYKHSQQLVYEASCKNVPLESTALGGAVFVDAGSLGGIGKGSFHFPATDPCAGDEKDSKTSGFYYNTENTPEQLRPPNEPVHWYFPRPYYYHAPTRTFSATFPFEPSDFPSTSRKQAHIRVVLTFSHDMQFVTRGVVVKRRQEYASLHEFQSVYPMDGVWSVESASETTRRTINRHRTDHSFLIGVGRTQIRLVGPLSNPNLPVSQTATFDLSKQPTGPHIGETLDWRRLSQQDSSGDGDNSTIVERWTRVSMLEQSALDALPLDSIAPIGGRSGRIFKRLHADNSSPASTPPTYRADCLWGNIFCQGGRVGLASYHFVGPSEAYISYEHTATSQWPPLDNGMPIPSRVAFHNTRQSDPHTFCGQICWLEDFGTTWQGCRRWDYEMRFDPQFLCIVSGAVHSVTDDFGAPQARSLYGEGLNYCNAALYSHLRSTISTSDATFDTMGEYLRDHGASPRTVALVHLVWRRAQARDGSNPIDWNVHRGQVFRDFTNDGTD